MMLTRESAMKRCLFLETELTELQEEVRKAVDAFFIQLLHEHHAMGVQTDSGQPQMPRYQLRFRAIAFLDLVREIVTYLETIVGPFFYDPDTTRYEAIGFASSRRLQYIEKRRAHIQECLHHHPFVSLYEIMFLRPWCFEVVGHDDANYAGAAEPFLGYLRTLAQTLEYEFRQFLQRTAPR